MSIPTKRFSKNAPDNNLQGVTLQRQVRNSDAEEWKNEGELFTFLLSDLPPTFTDGETQRCLAAYGLQKLFQERTSGVEGSAEKLAYIINFWENALKKGNWSLPRANASRKVAKDYTWVLIALYDLNKEKATPTQINILWSKKTDEEKEFIANKPDVVAKIAELQAASANASDIEL